MKEACLRVERAGPLSTLQDSGRFGFLDQGVATAGAFDPLYLAVANRLVGNLPDVAAIEMTLSGDTFRFQGDSCLCAIAGDFAVRVDGHQIQPWRSFTLRQGQLLSVGAAVRGVRGYLAVAGGFALSGVLGSRSVHVRSGIGPLEGKPLQIGTVLPLARDQASSASNVRFDTAALPAASERLRVVRGPQDHHFAKQALDAFFGGVLHLTPACDRMGFQVRGPIVQARDELPLISEGVALGSVQVLGDGLYILNMPDRQTVGGYPKIATIISCDIRQLAQMRPGAAMSLQEISIEEAQALFVADQTWRSSLDLHILPVGGITLTSEHLLAHNLLSGMWPAV